MSEYQYYDWQTIDRLLTEAGQDAVSGLSSHIEVTASQAVVTYNWSDFQHDPRKVQARYFDAYLYFANWGTRILMFRFPPGLLDEAAVAPCLVEDLIRLSTEEKRPFWRSRSRRKIPAGRTSRASCLDWSVYATTS